jgi:hypothetical protein
MTSEEEALRRVRLMGIQGNELLVESLVLFIKGRKDLHCGIFYCNRII